MRSLQVPRKKMLWELGKKDITYTTYSNFYYEYVNSRMTNEISKKNYS